MYLARAAILTHASSTLCILSMRSIPRLSHRPHPGLWEQFKDPAIKDAPPARDICPYPRSDLPGLGPLRDRLTFRCGLYCCRRDCVHTSRDWFPIKSDCGKPPGPYWCPTEFGTNTEVTGEGLSCLVCRNMFRGQRGDSDDERN